MGSKKVLKIIVAGNGGIGKTTLLKLFCYNQYSDDERLTVGNEIFLQKVFINGSQEFMQIWDLGGQEHFRFMLADFVRGADGAILGFDIKRRKTFMDLKSWLEVLRKHNPSIPIVLVATKLDLGYHPTLRPEMALNFVENNNLIHFIEISSKTKHNVVEPFKILLNNITGIDEDEIRFEQYNVAVC